MSPLNARMKSTSLSFRRSGGQSHATLGSAEAIQSERSLGMVCWLALREKRSERFLRLVGPYSFGEHLVLEFHRIQSQTPALNPAIRRTKDQGPRTKDQQSSKSEWYKKWRLNQDISQRQCFMASWNRSRVDVVGLFAPPVAPAGSSSPASRSLA